MPKSWTIHCYMLRLHGGRVHRFLPKGRSEFYVTFGEHVFQLTARSRKGITLVAQWLRGDRHYGRAAVMYEWSVPSMAIKKREVQKSDVNHLAAVESVMFNQHMALVEHCALRKYDDGSDREPGWLTIKVTGAAWVVQVKDPDSCTSFAAVADTLDKAVDTANLLLACDEAPWERDVWLEKSRQEKNRKK